MKLFYLHIPKTGGQTLATRLTTAFPADRSWILKNDIGTGAQLRELFQNHDLVEAHVRTGALNDANEEFDILCTIRNPIEHTRSHYQHVLRETHLRLHGPARRLGFRDFAEHYRESLFNQQSYGLVRAFTQRDIRAARIGREAWVTERLVAALDRVRWVVPTEQIDDFCRWWPVETQRPPLPIEVRINVAPATDERDPVAAFAREHPEHFGLDFTLWNLANARYERWRSGIVRRFAAAPHTELPNCAFSEDGLGAIWLLDGWYPRAVRGDGIAEWWAGPSELSEVLVERSPAVTQLKFVIATLIGFRHEGIGVFTAEGLQRLPTRIAPIEDGSMVEMVVDLPPGLGTKVDLLIKAPRVASFVEADEHSRDGRRRSFASQSWSLVRRP